MQYAIKTTVYNRMCSVWGVISAKIQAALKTFGWLLNQQIHRSNFYQAVFEARNSPFKFRATSAKIQAVFEERNSLLKYCAIAVIIAKIQAIFRGRISPIRTARISPTQMS